MIMHIQLNITKKHSIDDGMLFSGLYINLKLNISIKKLKKALRLNVF